MPFAETVLKITLDKQRDMYFNANTMARFEEVTGKFFLDTVSKLYDAFLEYEQTPVLTLEGVGASKQQTALTLNQRYIRLVGRVSVTDIRALVYSALHEYGPDDEPVWPLTINQVGRRLTPEVILDIIPRVMKGQSDNSPTKQEMKSASGEAKGLREEDGQKTSALVNGGASGIELPASAFDLPNDKPVV